MRQGEARNDDGRIVVNSGLLRLGNERFTHPLWIRRGGKGRTDEVIVKVLRQTLCAQHQEIVGLEIEHAQNYMDPGAATANKQRHVVFEPRLVDVGSAGVLSSPLLPSSCWARQAVQLSSAPEKSLTIAGMGQKQISTIRARRRDGGSHSSAAPVLCRLVPNELVRSIEGHAERIENLPPASNLLSTLKTSPSVPEEFFDDLNRQTARSAPKMGFPLSIGNDEKRVARRVGARHRVTITKRAPIGSGESVSGQVAVLVDRLMTTLAGEGEAPRRELCSIITLDQSTCASKIVMVCGRPLMHDFSLSRFSIFRQCKNEATKGSASR